MCSRRRHCSKGSFPVSSASGIGFCNVVALHRPQLLAVKGIQFLMAAAMVVAKYWLVLAAHLPAFSGWPREARYLPVGNLLFIGY